MTRADASWTAVRSFRKCGTRKSETPCPSPSAADVPPRKGATARLNSLKELPIYTDAEPDFEAAFEVARVHPTIYSGR